MVDFTQRDVIVTGGLGTAVVQRLLAAGAHVHVPVFHAKALEGCPFAEASGVTFYEAMNLTDEGHVAKRSPQPQRHQLLSVLPTSRAR